MYVRSWRSVYTYALSAPAIKLATDTAYARGYDVTIIMPCYHKELCLTHQARAPNSHMSVFFVTSTSLVTPNFATVLSFRMRPHPTTKHMSEQSVMCVNGAQDSPSHFVLERHTK